MRKTMVVTAIALLQLLTAHAWAAPTISVWHGLSQSFGQRGNPQTAINILGNVSDPGGMQSLNYRLNGGSQISLSIGPDTRRLLKAGDFNIDINTSSLNIGSNSVLITATNNSSQVSTATVTVNYTAGQTWPTTYSINWGMAGTVQSVAQVVDGHWTLFGGTVKPTSTQIGYDRLIAIGDKTWADYELTVPITINSIDSGGFGEPSNGPAVGLLFRWTGHTDTPISGWQPKSGYLPLGALGWYGWDMNALNPPKLRMLGNGLATMQEDGSGFLMTFGVTYVFKMRVTTIPGVGGEYRLRVWQQGQTEPKTWKLAGTQALSDPQLGSALLVAHHVDANFGNVTVTPVPAPGISNIQSAPGGTSATITWDTDIPSTSVVEYGLTASYELGSVSNSTLVSSHSIQVSSLSGSTTYHYRVRSADAAGNTGTSGDQTFTTTTVSNVTSDHLNQGSLNTGLWTYINPLADATLTMTGSQVSIAVPGGASHDVWTGGNFAPRIVQSVTNSDFEVQVKFDTPVNQVYQLEGIIVEQDANNFMRFDFVSASGITRIFSATFTNGVVTERTNSNIGGSTLSPLYLKVARQGNQWTQSYSFDGANWTVAPNSPYTHALTVTAVGPFIGNAGGASTPAFTGLIDYFVNLGEVVRPNLKAFLQGPFATPGDSMRTNLRSVVPLSQPYTSSPWNYAGTESVGTLPDSVVDWVLIELRSSTASTTKVGTRAAFIKRSGRVVDTNGISDVTFPGVKTGSYYLVLKHRNHLPIMTASAIALGTSSTLYSFTTAQTQAYGSSPMVQLATGVFGLPAGDVNSSLIITSADANNVFGALNATTYNSNDVNLSGVVTSADANTIFSNLDKSSQVP
ncbi:MAG: DUF1349 domain-containing protein [Ignavibacteriae bacterium]|nr:DUF1349 domain-containing protein [Ignavibacteriota bacterium]